MEGKEPFYVKKDIVDNNKAQYSIISNNSFSVARSFKKDTNFIFVLSKTEKLSTAVYLVTNLLSDNEPMKWKLRGLVLDLMSFNISLDKNQGIREGYKEKIQSNILEIISILDIATVDKTISAMNASILKDEFQSFLNHIYSVTDKNKDQNFLFSEDFFEVPDTTEEVLSKPGEQEGNEEPNIISRTKNSNSLKDKFLTLRDIPKKLDKKTNLLKEFGSVSIKKNQRKSTIISLLRKKKEVMVKDIASSIRNCSEKTIQRELLALVNEGLLKKEGERRWTKYSLA